jgi:urea transporter
MAEKSSPVTRQTDSKYLFWFGEIERKLAKLSMPTLTVPLLFFHLIILCGQANVSRAVTVQNRYSV